MLRHKIIVFLLFLGFLFFFGFLATYSNIKKQAQLPIITIANTPVDSTSSPSPENPTEVNTQTPSIVSSFDAVLHVPLHTQINFSDGLIVTLKQIDDSRCPAHVQCVWAGELSGVLVLSGPYTPNQEIHLSTVVNKTVVVGPYTFTIKDATAQSLDFIVSKK